MLGFRCLLILQIYLGRLVYVASLLLHVFLLIGILRIILIILNNGRSNSISDYRFVREVNVTRLTYNICCINKLNVDFKVAAVHYE